MYVGGALWHSFDGYAASASQRDIVISAGIDSRKLYAEGPHLLEIRNRVEKNKTSSGNKVRFKQLVVADRTYDLHTIEYAYDNLSRLTEARYNPGTNLDAIDADLLRRYLFTYDRAGNRLSESLALNGGAPTVTNFTYNAANQMTSNGSVSFAYDNNGNLITANSVPVMTWDRANRLLSATDGVTTSQYAYDGEGHRIKQTVGATITKYLLDLQPGLSLVLAETVGANTKRFVHGPMGIHAQEDAAGVWTWAVQDALGNVRLEASNALAVNGMRNFAPPGVVFGQQGSFSTPYGFTGEPTDGNGLVHLRARYYTPALGVFTALDPFEGTPSRPMSLNGYSWVEGNVPNDAVGELLGLINGYSYANGNPVNFVDPSGMMYEKPGDWDPCAASKSAQPISLKVAQPPYDIPAQVLPPDTRGLEQARFRPPCIYPYIATAQFETGFGLVIVTFEGFRRPSYIPEDEPVPDTIRPEPFVWYGVGPCPTSNCTWIAAVNLSNEDSSAMVNSVIVTATGNVYRLDIQCQGTIGPVPRPGEPSLN